MLSESPKAKLSTAAWCVFALALLLRVYNLNLPFLEPYNSVSRQAIVASVARNFYQHGFQFFYPEIDENGPGPYLYNAEMPFYSYAMAIGYALAGGVREWVARGVSVAFSMLTLALMYGWIRRAGGEKTAVFALLFLAVSPLYLGISRSIQPEAAMLFAATAALYAYARFRERPRPFYFMVSALCMALAVATKIHAVYFFIPLVFMAWREQGPKFLLEKKTYAYAAAALLPLVWYVWMWREGQAQPLIYEPYDFTRTRAEPGLPLWRLFLPPHTGLPAKIFFIHLLTPIGSLAFLAGWFGKKAKAEEKIFYAWFLATALFCVLFWRTVIQHGYYQALFAPPAAFFVGKGAQRIVENPAASRFLTRLSAQVLVLLVLIESLVYFYPGIYFIPEKLKSLVAIGRAVESDTPKDSLVVASYGASPIQLYYCNRKGWAFDVRTADQEGLIRRFEDLRKEGADYFVLTRLDQFRAVPLFEKHVRGRYPLIQESEDSVLFALRP